jgi:hypothetical protein
MYGIQCLQTLGSALSRGSLDLCSCDLTRYLSLTHGTQIVAFASRPALGSQSVIWSTPAPRRTSTSIYSSSTSSRRTRNLRWLCFQKSRHSSPVHSAHWHQRLNSTAVLTESHHPGGLYTGKITGLIFQTSLDPLSPSIMSAVEADMVEKGFSICKEFLGGSWSRVSKKDFCMKRIRFVLHCLQ